MVLVGYCGSRPIDALVSQGLYNEIDAGLCVKIGASNEFNGILLVCDFCKRISQHLRNICQTVN
jgi:hypothetical protein